MAKAVTRVHYRAVIVITRISQSEDFVPKPYGAVAHWHGRLISLERVSDKQRRAELRNVRARRM